MADPNRLPRPRQATTAAVMGGLASLFMVLATFDVMAGLRSIEARERIAEKLASPAYQDLGIAAGAVSGLLRGVLLVNGALAAAAVVLAVYVLQRHRGARIGFGVSAGLLFVGTFVLADWLPGVPFGIPLVLAFAASMMWSPPVRDWYAGRAPAPARQGATPESRSPSARSSWAPPSVQAPAPQDDRSDQPASTAQPGEPAGEQPVEQPPPAAYPFGERPPSDRPAWTSPAQPTPTDPTRPFADQPTRPPAVTAAIVLTWIVTPLVMFVFGLVVLMLLVARDTLLEAVRQTPELEASGYTTDELMAGLWVASALLLFWCLVACVLAFFAFRRQSWARGFLVGSAVMAALVSLLALPLGLMVAIPSAASAVMLLSGSARAWYAAPPPPQGPPPPPTATGGSQRPTRPQQLPPPPPPRSKPPVW